MFVQRDTHLVFIFPIYAQFSRHFFDLALEVCSFLRLTNAPRFVLLLLDRLQGH